MSFVKTKIKGLGDGPVYTGASECFSIRLERHRGLATVPITQPFDMKESRSQAKV